MSVRVRPGATLHRHRAGAKDELGDPAKAYDDEPIEVDVQRLAGAQAGELRDGRNVLISEWVAFFKPGESLSGHDQLTVDGQRFAFDGEPWLVRNPRTGRASHWEANLRKVT